MPKAWLCIPSARPVAEVGLVVAKWKAMGYGVALWRDDPRAPAGIFACKSPEIPNDLGADIVFLSARYPGYAVSVNAMAPHILERDTECDWIVVGGDDTFPDPTKRADEIARECSEHFFRGGYEDINADGTPFRKHTFGVMQPTGDPWADHLGRIIERIAGSPWLGRSWCRRAHGGKGPLFPDFRHMFVDEALQLYAQSLGVFWQRPDLTHFHAHAQRDLANPARLGGVGQPAPHMKEWNSQKHWQESKAIFERLKSTNFAECQPIL
jgi:hypothetical protein